MPWKETRPLNERARFVIDFERGRFTMRQLCIAYEVSRKTGYKWLERYRESGVAGLSDRSRAPHGCPHRMSEEMEAFLIQERVKHPHWGPRKLLEILSNFPRESLQELFDKGERLPAASTVGEALKRAGLVHSRKRRKRPPHPGTCDLASVAIEPNDVWSTDFKGEFRTQDGRWCFPLTVSDAVSRYLLECKGLPSTEHAGAQPCFERLFREHGLPGAIRSVNGCPFCSVGLCGLSRLSVWWMKLGIVHQRIQPGKPQQNGRHERMHRTLKAETTRPPAQNMQKQQERFAAFRDEYNQERPHEALGMQTPSAIWTPSKREMPKRIPEPEYAGHMEVRSVRGSGEIKFLQRCVFVSQVLQGEQVALEEIDDGIWSLYFCKTLLGRIDLREKGERGQIKLIPIRQQVATTGNEGKLGTDQASQRSPRQ